MNETMKTILERRSIRKFTDKPVPEEILADLAEAAMHAPSFIRPSQFGGILLAS